MRNVRRGFTLIELSLSIAFLSILAITITMIIMNTLSSYHRGLTLNNINSTGMDLIDDLRATIQNSPSGSIANLCQATYATDDSEDDDARNDCEKDHAKQFVALERRAKVSVAGNVLGEDIPVFGALCTGRYSYIWSSGYFFSGDDATVDLGAPSELDKPSFTYKDANGDKQTIKQFRLLKVEDNRRAVCIAATRGGEGSSVGQGENYGSVINYDSFNITKYYNKITEEPVDLLTERGNMAVYYLDSALPADGGGELLYPLTFILGTTQGGINIAASGNYCATPGGYLSAVENMDYCAINKFNFAVQATGG